jgi:thymidine kinase
VAKLYFRYGTMNSAKTLNLLAVAHNYESQGKKVLLGKPAIDDRFGSNIIKSRAGLERKCDFIIPNEGSFDLSRFFPLDCVILDEAQFLSRESVNLLRNIATYDSIPVICYGLRTDFKTNLFPGAQRLFELADSIEEVKSTCIECNKKSLFNMRFKNGKAVAKGEQVEIGAEDLYKPVCSKCYSIHLGRF